MWLESMVPAFKAASPFQDQLLTGVVLCTLLKQVDPDTKARASLMAQKGSYFARDNVAIFLRAWNWHPRQMASRSTIWSMARTSTPW